jgi:hypothetical protein
MRRAFAAAMIAIGVAGAARAETGASVYCGSVRCVTLRAAAHGQSPQQRADAAMGLLNKYLGGKQGRFTTVRRGTEVELLLNGEQLLSVTPTDAKQEKARSATILATSWRAAFTKAFMATRAQK